MDTFKDGSLLITGGTGSFGNAVLKKFLTKGLKRIVIFSRDEKKQDDMRRHYGDPRIEFMLGDVRDFESLARAVDGVDYIFHAAALKQVPSCEFFPIEAVRTNVEGTDNVLRAAYASGVKGVCLLSTDKAVYPINAMGISKAMAEKVLTAYARFHGAQPKTVVFATRYGNVMGSRGSVIPIFKQQAEAGAPVTITDPAMTRFLMSLEQSVELVEFAFKNATPGDIFVHKAPSATVQDLADAIIKLTNSSSTTEVIGTRHGEKLYESLVSTEEMAKADDLGDFFRIPMDARDLNYEKYFSRGVTTTEPSDEFHSHNARRLDVNGIMELLTRQEFWGEGQ